MKMTTDVSDFVSAGFRIIRLVERATYMSASLLPNRILSLSSCITEFVPDTWCIEWTQDSPKSRIDTAQHFGIDQLSLTRLTDWITARFDTSIYWPNAIEGITTAQEIVQRFLCDVPDLRLVEMGLHRSLVQTLLQEAESPPTAPGFASIGRQGVVEMLVKDRVVSDAGMQLGFEPLVYDTTLSHSWLCNYLEVDVAEVLGIRPNANGLIGRWEDALRVMEYISGNHIGAEPGLWMSWLIVDHTPG